MKKLVVLMALLLTLNSCATVTRYFGLFPKQPEIGMREDEFRKIAPFNHEEKTYRSKYGIVREYIFTLDHVNYRFYTFENGVLTHISE
jgi:hypothetical protein